jgi:hypothetical protein
MRALARVLSCTGAQTVQRKKPENDYILSSKPPRYKALASMRLMFACDLCEVNVIAKLD